jgi:hypothetical protein
MAQKVFASISLAQRVSCVNAKPCHVAGILCKAKAQRLTTASYVNANTRGNIMSTHIQFTRPALLDSIVRLNNSRNGNPSYMLGFADGLTGKTKTDAGFAYAIHDGMSYVTVKYHFTPKGKCIIDDISERG